MWSTHSRRIDPINLSAKPFYQGEPGAMGLSRGSSAVELISITDQIARSLIPRECLRDLVGNPVRGRMRCDIDPDKKVLLAAEVLGSKCCGPSQPSPSQTRARLSGRCQTWPPDLDSSQL